MATFLAGAIAMGFVVVAAFFLRFWRRTADALFLIFAIAFLILATGQGIVALEAVERESRSWVYLLRAAAFMLIIGGIVAKNLPRR